MACAKGVEVAPYGTNQHLLQVFLGFVGLNVEEFVEWLLSMRQSENYGTMLLL